MKPKYLLSSTLMAAALVVSAPFNTFYIQQACAQQQTQQTTDALEQLKSWQFGKSREPLYQIEELIRSSKPEAYKEIEHKLIAILKDTKTTKDAKRNICKWLVIVGSEECVSAVAELLTDPDLSNPARIAIEPMNNPAAGAALRNALQKVDGKLLAGVISSIGVRRDQQATPLLIKYLTHQDPVIAETAMAALGQIGNDEAVTALEQLRPPQNLERARARSLATAAFRLAEAGQKTRASAIFKTLFDSAPSPAVKITALNGLVNTLPTSKAVSFLTDQLQSQDEQLRATALSALRQCPSTAVQNRVARKLPQLNPESQLAVLAILADLDNVNARMPVLRILQSSNDDKVRAAALECLVRHGEAADVVTITELAAQKSAISDAALRTLQRMNKPGVDNALVKLIEAQDASLRAVALNVISNRRVESALPTLVRLLHGNDSVLATEAAKGLAILGTSTQVQDLAQTVALTETPELREAAANAIKTIARKTIDKAALSAILLTEYNKAKTVAARVLLLQLLGFTGGGTALNTVVNALNDTQQEIRNAAFNTLVSWYDDSAATHLIDIAKTTSDERQATVALRDGCLRLAEMEEIPANRRVQIIENVLAVAKRTEEKKRAISLLGEIPIPEALKILQKIAASDQTLMNDAVAVTIRLARQIGAVYPQQAIGALEDIKLKYSDDSIRKQADTAIAAIKNAGLSPEGFILAWFITPPYSKEGKNGSELFDEVFPPEQSNSTVEWRPFTLPPNKKNGLIEFDKMNAYKGENRVVYLKTTIVSESDQEARLDMGSDDGIKVWLNGKVVHSNNAVRPCSPGEDRIKTKLNKGENTLLIKLTQGGGEWATTCKICSPDGKELQGISIMPKN